jgi:lactoylglutathione lyase
LWELILKEITRINHVGLRVRDLNVAREFYEKLGFEFLGGPMGPEPVAIVEHPSGVNINFILNASTNASPTNVLMDDAEKHTGFTHIALEITDADAVERQLGAHGIEITERVEFEGAKFFFVRDPDDNVIEFHRPAP